MTILFITITIGYSHFENSAAMAASLDEECDVVEEPSDDCLEYGQQLDELYALLASTGSSNTPAASILEPLQDLPVPSTPGVPGANSDAIQTALQKAQAATKEFGSTSVEARLAWETLEELNASGLENAMGAGLDTENCSVEEQATQACEALEALQQVLERNQQD